MSAFRDRIAANVAKFEELGLSPLKQPQQTLRIPCDGTEKAFDFIVGDETLTGVISLAKVACIRVEAGFRKRAKGPKNGQAHQAIVIAHFVGRGFVRIQEEDGSFSPLSMEQVVWGHWGSDPSEWLLRLKGQHQGVDYARIEALRELLMANRWQDRAEPPENPGRKTLRVNPDDETQMGFSLETRGKSGTPEQFKRSNGALHLSEIVVRSAQFPNPDGTDTKVGFDNFGAALEDNFERYMKWREALAGEAADIQAEAEKGVFSITGAHTIRHQDGKVRTYLDSADIPEWTYKVFGPSEDGTKTVQTGTENFGLWAPSEDEDEAPEGKAVVDEEEPF